MNGLLKPDSGKVCIESEDIAQAGEKDLSRVRRNIGFQPSARLQESFYTSLRRAQFHSRRQFLYFALRLLPRDISDQG
jgi:ABC-type phosphate/phosphonate transport system ATPase subunit